MGGDNYQGGGGQIAMFFAIIFGALGFLIGAGLAIGFAITLLAATVGLP